MRYTYLLLFIILCCFACKEPKYISSTPETPARHADFVLKEALLTCFEEGMTFDDGLPYNCEYSAVAQYEGSLIFGNDKNTSKVSPMMLANGKTLKEGNMLNPFELKQEEFFNIYKIEDFAFTMDKRTLFITSGFDRLKDDNNSWDQYNCLLTWNIMKNEFQMVNRVDNGGVISSKNLRYKFLDMLNSTHMKIEGLAILPNNKLVFGVREVGESFQNPTYTSTLIECSYSVNTDGNITLADDFKIAYTMNSSTTRNDLGLSSIFYDQIKQIIYITTSYESGEEGIQELGGYIWELPLADYIAGRRAKVVVNDKDEPFALRHKVEGITQMDDGNYFIIYDNDRTDVPIHIGNSTISRARNQAVYSIVKLP
jgi:hypothetical protein